MVNLQLDWGGETARKTMKAYFYPTENTAGTSGLPVFLEGSGGEVSGQLPDGSYRLITYNTDVTGVAFSEMSSYQTATVAAAATSTRADVVLVEQPSAFYACSQADGITTSLLDPLKLTASPRQLTRTLNLKIRLSDVRGVDVITGTLNGMYPSLLLSTGAPAPESVASAPSVRSGFQIEHPSNEVEISLRTLGILNPENGKVYRSIMELVLRGNDGWSQAGTVDMTDVLTDIISKNNDDLPANAPVEIEMEIKAVGTALQATVKSWKQGSGDGYIYE